MDLNWDGVTEDGFMLAPPGVYLAEVDKVEMETSDSGNQMLIVQLRDAKSRAMICQDNIMLEGRGRGIGMAKLIQLGVAKGTTSFEPLSLTGRRVRIAVHHEEWNGKPRASVDIGADGFKCGMLAVPDDGAASASATTELTPF